jgi:hypothetical protein
MPSKGYQATPKRPSLGKHVPMADEKMTLPPPKKKVKKSK